MLASFGAYSLEKKVSRTPSRVRQRGHRGRCRTGSRQQRRRADLVHPHADTGHTVQSGDGLDDWSHDHPGHPAGSGRDDGAAHPVLGTDRVDVDRQSVPSDPESAANRPLDTDDHDPRFRFLYPAIIVFCCIGVFSLQNSTFDVFLMALFGLCGYIFKKLDAEPAPMLLAFILGPMMEEFLRRAMLLSKGDPVILITRPISAVMLAMAAGLYPAGAVPCRQQEKGGSIPGGANVVATARQRSLRTLHT